MANAYLIEVSGLRIKKAMPLITPHHLTDDLIYNVCSGCSAIVKDTWDHDKTCWLFKEETLVAWVNMGLKEKNS